VKGGAKPEQHDEAEHRKFIYGFTDLSKQEQAELRKRAVENLKEKGFRKSFISQLLIEGEIAEIMKSQKEAVQR